MRMLSNRRCPHRALRPIYGDEIIFGTPNFNRLQCRTCRRYLDGPVTLGENMAEYCCTPNSGDCCGPGSWCCGRAGAHEHEDEPPRTA